jgi:hypothetical protein
MESRTADKTANGVAGEILLVLDLVREPRFSFEDEQEQEDEDGKDFISA